MSSVLSPTMPRHRRAVMPVLAMAAALALGACSGLNQTEQRTLSGGAIGAGVGAVAGAVTGGCVGCGAVIGGAVGAGAGYISTKLK